MQGLFKIAKGEKVWDLGFLGRAGPPDDRLWLRKIRSWEKSILFSSKHAHMPYPNGKIIAVERVQAVYWLVVGTNSPVSRERLLKSVLHHN